ncbi:MAG: hypothetical protein K0R00_2490 [Herbinix sp.]|jgi:hypothetical protein|nr:hypothetical protein [Herbinix sp.]
MDTLYRQFKEALKREGKTVKGYYNNTDYTCLFRKNSDDNTTDGHVTIFYEIGSGIYQGQLLSFGEKHFVVLNQESVENSVYYKSALLECNILLPLVENMRYKYIPCYAYGMTSPTVISNNIMSIVDGKCEIISEYTDKFTTSIIDLLVNILGGYYKIQNVHNKSGIAHVYVERGLQPSWVYDFTLSADGSQYLINTTTTLIPLATKSSIVDDTATITYTSSNNAIAIVNSSGVVSFISPGTVTITATWVEQNKTDTVTLTVLAEILPYTFNLTTQYLPEDTCNLGTAKIYKVSLVDKVTSLPVDFTPSWTFNWNGMASNNFTVTYPTTYQCSIKTLDDNYDLLGLTYVVTCSCTYNDKLYSDSLTVTIELY